MLSLASLPTMSLWTNIIVIILLGNASASIEWCRPRSRSPHDWTCRDAESSFPTCCPPGSICRRKHTSWTVKSLRVSSKAHETLHPLKPLRQQYMSLTPLPAPRWSPATASQTRRKHMSLACPPSPLSRRLHSTIGSQEECHQRLQNFKL